MVPPLELTGGNREFHLEEYKQLRTEVTGLLARIELLFRYSMVVAATVFAWLVSNSMGVEGTLIKICLKLPPHLLWFGWFIAPAFILCAGLMAYTTSKRVNEIGEYLRKLEEVLGRCPPLGWEAHLSGKPSILTPMTKRLWWLLFGLALVATVVALFAVQHASGSCRTK